MTDLRSAMNDYLTVRRQLGFELKGPGRRLEDFIVFMQRAGAEHVTTELALRWATSSPGAPVYVPSAPRGGPRLRQVPDHDRPSERGSLEGSAAQPSFRASLRTCTRRLRSKR